ncbi:hypothetical protein GCM10010411_48590 [Actinomadura fulvescens]|uniref:Uncharacterized protein n=1 Tax=Actinomadura fulvescens TaxID=46160 RepID=A0ABN3Q2R3_9ACTN
MPAIRSLGIPHTHPSAKLSDLNTLTTLMSAAAALPPPMNESEIRDLNALTAAAPAVRALAPRRR